MRNSPRQCFHIYLSVSLFLDIRDNQYHRRQLDIRFVMNISLTLLIITNVAFVSGSFLSLGDCSKNLVVGERLDLNKVRQNIPEVTSVM